MNSLLRVLSAACVLVLSAVACGPQSEPDRSQDTRNVDETKASPGAGYRVRFTEPTPVWTRRSDGILQTRTVLPVGTEILVARSFSSEFPDYLDSNGQVKRPSMPFIAPLNIVSVPADAKISAADIAGLNATPGGLLLTEPSGDWLKTK